MFSLPQTSDRPSTHLSSARENVSSAWVAFDVDDVVTAVSKQPARMMAFSIRAMVPEVPNQTCLVFAPVDWKTDVSYVAVVPNRVVY